MTGFGKVIAFGIAALGSGTAYAWEADVEKVELRQADDGSYTFDVTVSHADEGWSHYADGWEVIGPDGEVLGKRELMHPHVEEQPFTRSLGGVRISDGIGVVTIRAHDNQHGYGGAEVEVALPER